MRGVQTNPLPTPSLNADREAGDRSVTMAVDRDVDDLTIRVRPYPDTDPIMVVTLDALGVDTLLRAVRLLREQPERWREPHMADDINRIDKIGSACERALRIYVSWVEERERASQVSEAAAVLRRRESEARRRREASGEGDERRRGGQDGA